MFSTGAVTSHGGNMSQRCHDSIWISRRDSMLGNFMDGDIVQTTYEPSERDASASRELVVHRTMYHASKLETAAIVHGHTPHTIARSFDTDMIVPIDSEGKYAFGASEAGIYDPATGLEGVPVLTPAESIGSSEAAQMLAEVISKGGQIGVLRGHGPFAIADTLERAFRLVSILEMSCRILDIRDATAKNVS